MRSQDGDERRPTWPGSPGAESRSAPPHPDRRKAPWWSEIVGGTTGSVVMLAVVLTLGLLGFAPLGASAVPLGLAAAFVSIIVGGIVVALAGRVAMPTAGPSSATALILASLIAQLAQDPQWVAGDPRALENVVTAAAVAVVLMGVMQVVFARLGLGRLALFVPQPVLAGFMNGVALLILLSQLPALLGLHGAALRDVGSALAGAQPATLAVGLATAAVTWLVAWQWPRAPSQLIGLAAGIGLYAALHFLQPALALGPLVGPLPQALPLPDLPLRLMAAGPAEFVWRHAGAVLATALILALIGSLESLLSAVALDQHLDAQHNPGDALMTLGAANIVVGLFGGLPTVVLRARALATLRAGGVGRRAAIAGAIAFAVMYVLLGPAIALLPMVVLAGIMVTVAFDLVDRWTHRLLDQWRRGERSADVLQSLAIVAIVCGVTVWKGFGIGVATGCVAALLVFIRSMNRSLLRSRHTAESGPSRRIYPTPQEDVLHAARARILVLELEGALFFGSAERLARAAEDVGADTQYMVLDLRAVSTIDASGAMVLQQLSTRLQRRGIALLLAGVSEENTHGRQLRAFGCFRESPRDDWFADTDRATEFAELALLLEAGLPLGDGAVPVESSSLFRGLLPAQCAMVVAQMQPVRLAAGELLFRQGDAADRLYVLTRGSITVIAGEGPEHDRQRYVSFSPALMLGETAMLDGGGRSASATADSDAELQQLTQRDLDNLAERDPDLVVMLYRNIAVHLSERLRRATSLRRMPRSEG